MSEGQKQQVICHGSIGVQRWYCALRANPQVPAYHPRRDELKPLYEDWLSCVDDFKEDLCLHGSEPEVIACINEIFGDMDMRIRKFATMEG